MMINLNATIDVISCNHRRVIYVTFVINDLVFSSGIGLW